MNTTRIHARRGLRTVLPVLFALIALPGTRARGEPVGDRPLAREAALLDLLDPGLRTRVDAAPADVRGQVLDILARREEEARFDWKAFARDSLVPVTLGGAASTTGLVAGTALALTRSTPIGAAVTAVGLLAGAAYGTYRHFARRGDLMDQAATEIRSLLDRSGPAATPAARVDGDGPAAPAAAPTPPDLGALTDRAAPWEVLGVRHDDVTAGDAGPPAGR